MTKKLLIQERLANNYSSVIVRHPADHTPIAKFEPQLILLITELP